MDRQRAKVSEVCSSITRHHPCPWHGKSYEKGFGKTSGLTWLVMPDASSLLGTTSPLLNSESFRISCGCGAAVSEHLTGNALMRIVKGLRHPWCEDSASAPPSCVEDVLSPTLDCMLLGTQRCSTGNLDKKEVCICHSCAALDALNADIWFKVMYTNSDTDAAAVAAS